MQLIALNRIKAVKAGDKWTYLKPKGFRAWKEWVKQRKKWKQKLRWCNLIAGSEGDKLSLAKAFTIWQLRFSKRKADLDVMTKPQLVLTGEKALIGIDDTLECRADQDSAILQLQDQNRVLTDNLISSQRLALDAIHESHRRAQQQALHRWFNHMK